jgi:hypothetical protein
VKTEEFKKACKEFDKILGLPASTFARDNWLLLLSVVCTVALYAFYESAPPATTGRFNPPFHKPALAVALFSFCGGAIGSATWVLVRGWTAWQRSVASILVIFPSLFLIATFLWLLKKAL